MKRFLSVRELTLYAFLGAGLFAAKLAMAQLPNIEPVTLLVMLFAVCFGWKSLCAVAVYAALEFFLWGAGLWAVCYLYIWLVPFLLARAARRVDSPLWWAALSGAFGLLFGALCAPVYWVAGGWAAALSWWAAGIPMDLLHGAGNFFLALVLFRPMRRWLSALARRYGLPGAA
ncbi:hypothetical protein [Dysosmobacter sp.]